MNGWLATACAVVVWVAGPRAWSAGDPPPGPGVEALFPAGGQRGQALSVDAVGNGIGFGWPWQVWTDDAALAVEPTGAPGQFRVTIAAHAKPGAHLVRFYNAAGCTAPRLFVVGDNPEITELDSLERRGAGEEIRAFPVTVNGRLREPGETDAFLLVLEPGQILGADLVAARLDSPLPARLVLVDPTGRNLAASTNEPPQDPALEQRIWTSGSHRLLVAASRDPKAGVDTAAFGEGAIYRLTLTATAGPRPAAVPGSVLYESPSVPGLAAQVVVRAGAEWSEPEHPETLPPTMDLPGSFTGFINPPGDEDRFSFIGRRDELHRFSLLAESLISPFNPVLRILDPGGRVLAETTPGLAATLDWVIPWEGSYLLAVADSDGGGGPDCRYQLELWAPEPHLTAQITNHTLRLEPAGRLDLTVSLRRPETHRGVLTVVATGLPAGITLSGGVFAPAADEAVVRLTAADLAVRVNQPFQMTLLDASSFPLRFHPVRAPLRGRHTPPGGLLVNETDTLWLTVAPPERNRE